MKIRELEALLAQHGWREAKRIGSSHRKWLKDGEKPILIYGNSSREADKGLENSLLRRLGLK